MVLMKRYNRKATIMTNSIKICCVVHSLKAGGMERVMTELANNFALRDNVEVHLILYGIRKEIFYEINKTVHLHAPYFRFRNSKRTIYTLRTMRWLRTEIKTLNADTVLSFGEYWNSFVLLSLLGLKYPVFVSDRCQPNKKLGLIHDFLRKHLYKKAAGIICQTEQAKAITLNRYAYRNVVVIGNPIRAIQANGAVKWENIIVSVGRMIDTKNFDRLISIFATLNVSSWKLVIIGGDDNKQSHLSQLKEQIRALRLEGKVLLEGYRQDIDAYLLRCKIFALTSSSEGFPNVIGEAMSAGLPVVAYNCVAGPRDMIEDGKNGFLIPIFDDRLFSERLQYLITHEEEREQMGHYAQHSIQKYATDIVCEQFYQLLTEKNEKTATD